MAEPIEPTQPTEPQPAADPKTNEPSATGGKTAPAVTRKRRRWPLIVLGVLLAILLLVALLPTLLSMGWARSIAVNQVNGRINGKMQIDDWSFGWTTGAKIHGVKLFDADGRQILQMESLTTGLTLINIAQGKYNLGDATLQGLNFNLKQYADGTTTLSRLMTKPRPAEPAPPAPAPSAPAPSAPPSAPDTPPVAQAKPQPVSLPHISGKIRIVQCRGTYDTDATEGHPAHSINLRSIDGEATIPDTNSAIKHTLTVVASVDNRPPGTLVVDGTVDVVRDNHIELDGATADETIKLAALELGTIGAMMPPAGAISELAGVTDGTVKINLDGKGQAALDLNIVSQNVLVGGSALKNVEKIRAERLVISVPAGTKMDMSGGNDDWERWPIVVGGGSPGQAISILATGPSSQKLIEVRLAAQTTTAAVMNLAKGMQPGGDGFVQFDAFADIGKLNIPATLAMQDGVTLTSGVVTASAGSKFAGTYSTLSTSAQIRDVAGRDTKAKRDVKLEPITLDLKANSFGGGWSVPDLRDISMTFAARGADAKFEGKTLAALNGKLHAVLETLQSEFGQFHDFAGYQLKGDVLAEVTASGDFAAALATTQPAGASAVASAAPAGQSSFAATVTARGLNIRPPATQPITQDFIQTALKATVIGDPRNPTGLRDASVTALAGQEQSPLIAAALVAPSVEFRTTQVVDPKTRKSQEVKQVAIPSFALQKGDITDLARAQDELGGFIPALRDYRIQKGSITLAGTGSYDGKTLRFVLPAANHVNGVTLFHAPAGDPGKPTVAPVSKWIEVLNDYSLSFGIDAASTSDATMSRTSIAQLSLSDNKGWFNVSVPAQSPIDVTVPTKGQPTATGAVQVGVALVPVNDMLRRLGGENPVQIAAASAPGAPTTELRDGRLDGTINFGSSKDAGAIALGSDLKLSQITVARGGVPVLTNESITVTLRSSAKPDFSALAVSQLDAVGSLVDARVSKVDLLLKAGTGANQKDVPTLRKLRRLEAAIKLPDLARAQSLYDAFFPPAASKPATAGATSQDWIERLRPANAIALVDGDPTLSDRAMAVRLVVDEITWTPLDKDSVPVAARQTLQGQPGGKKADVKYFRGEQNGQTIYRGEFRFENGTQRMEIVIAPDGKALSALTPVNKPKPPVTPPVIPPVNPPAVPPVTPPAVTPSVTPKPPVGPVPPATPIPAPATPRAAPVQAGLKGPVPPAKLVGGFASVTLQVSTDDSGKMTIVPVVDAQNVSIGVGEIRHAMGNISVTSRALLIPSAKPVAADAPMLTQLAELQIPELTASLAGTTVKLKEPMILKDLAALSAPTTAPSQPVAATASINAGLIGNGDLAQIMALLDVLGGQKPQLAYFGKFEFDQKVTSANGTMKVDGQAVVRDFQVHDPEGKTTFSEPVIRVTNSVTADDKTQTLSLDKVGLAMETSKALAVELTGKIADYKNARRFEGDGLVATLTYDLPKVWPILQPYMKPVPDPATGKTPEDYYAGLQIAGVYTKKFAVTGSFPADGPTGMAGLKNINATGGFTIDQLVLPKMGLTMGKADLNVLMDKGIAKLLNPPPIPMNGGNLNLAKDGKSFELDLTGEHPRLSGPPGLVLLQNISGNPVFANFLGDYINNPLMLKPQEAAGAINLTIVQLDRLPVDKRLIANDPTNDGKIVADLTMGAVKLTPTFLEPAQNLLASLTGNNKLGVDLKQLQGDIKNYRIIVEYGTLTHKMELTLGEHDRPLQLYGNVRLEDKQMLPLSIFLPTELLRLKQLPKGIEIPLWGQATAPQFNMQEVLQKNLVNQFLDLSKLGDLFPKKKDDPKNPASTQPAKEDPLGGLLDLINRPKKDDKKKDKDK